jgi:oligopeptidase B
MNRLLVSLLIVACAKAPAPVTPVVVPVQPVPPVAEVRAHDVASPNGTRDDPYYWMRDDERKDPAVLGYLAAENTYTRARLAHLSGLQDTLFDEIVGRIQRDDTSVPYRKHGWWRYTRYESDQQYPIHARKKETLEAPEQVLLDVNALAEGHAYFRAAGVSPSPGGTLLAWAEDTVGRNQYTVRFRDLATGEMLPDAIDNTTGNVAWASDDKTLFYIEKDPVTLLGVRVKRHLVGTDASADVVVYEETDHSFYLSVGRSGDDAYVVIRSGATITDEVRFVSADAPDGPFQVVLPRERGHEYSAQHIGDRWIVRTNDEAANFRLMELADADVGDREAWRELVAHDDAVYLSGFAVFDDFLALGERAGGLQRIRVRDWAGEQGFVVDADEDAYVASLSTNSEQDSEWLRYSYTSLKTPVSTFEVNMLTQERRLLKQEPVVGYDDELYASERVWATARDGVKVPVSLVYKKGFEKNGTGALYQYGYGSYGSSSDPWFRSHVMTLLDRGFVYAIAHARGGQEMGRSWYDDGKLLNKMNTFNDFIDVTEHLVATGWCDPEKVAAGGGSAGGLLIGAVANHSAPISTPRSVPMSPSLTWSPPCSTRASR